MPKFDIKLQIDGVGEAIMPRAQLTKYALNPEKVPDKVPDKVKAFKLTLGYTLGNVDDLIDNIKVNINEYPRVEKEGKGYVTLFSVTIRLKRY